MQGHVEAHLAVETQRQPYEWERGRRVLQHRLHDWLLLQRRCQPWPSGECSKSRGLDERERLAGKELSDWLTAITAARLVQGSRTAPIGGHIDRRVPRYLDDNEYMYRELLVISVHEIGADPEQAEPSEGSLTEHWSLAGRRTHTFLVGPGDRLLGLISLDRPREAWVDSRGYPRVAGGQGAYCCRFGRWRHPERQPEALA